MGYLSDKRKESAEYDSYEVVAVKDIENKVFTFKRVTFKDLTGKYGLRKTAICDIEIDGEMKTIFIDKMIIYKTLVEGVADGHDWVDGEQYCLCRTTKKDGSGEYWDIREA